MKLSEMEFKRKFSLNMCKTLKMPIADMTFTSDFYDGNRGDLYPLVDFLDDKEKKNEYKAQHGVFYHTGGHLGISKRYFTQLFPYATYEITLFGEDNGSAGFSFEIPGMSAIIAFTKGGYNYTVEYLAETGRQEHYICNHPGDLTAMISLRPGAFEIYVKEEYGVKYICTFEDAAFDNIHKESVFQSSMVTLFMRADMRVRGVHAYMDSGLGLADMRSVRYENGEVMLEGGRMYFTASIRRRWGTHQGVFSWVPGTADFALVGTLFFDSGDGYWCDDVATSLIFNRMDNKWHLHVASFAHGHIVGGAIFENDVRFGLNVVDIKLMTPATATDGSEDDLFLGKIGDEDPDLIYDEKRKKWLFSLCRKSSATLRYKYFFFESDYPDRGFEIVGHGIEGEETGGSIMPVDGEMYFICGNSRKARADYRVYKWGEFTQFENLHFDHPDGGFRGWGTILPIKIGTRQRLFHLTFDRVRMSEYEWSYGNMYCFEGESRKLYE